MNDINEFANELESWAEKQYRLDTNFWMVLEKVRELKVKYGVK